MENIRMPRQVRPRGSRGSYRLPTSSRGRGCSISTRGRGRSTSGRGRGRSTSSRGRGHSTFLRGVSAGASSSRFFLGHVDNQPVDTPLETPLHKKTKRSWMPVNKVASSSSITTVKNVTAVEYVDALELSANPEQQQPLLGVSPIASLSPMFDVSTSVPSPVQFVECEDSEWSVPSEDVDVLAPNSFGSEDEADEGNVGDDENPQLILPRFLRVDFDDDVEAQETTPDFSWPPQRPLTPPSSAHGIERNVAAQAIAGPTDLFEFDWRPLPNPPIPTTERREQFSPRRRPGPTVAMADPYECFVAIWDRPIMEHIARETNKYAEQQFMLAKANNTLKRRSRLCYWKSTDVDELYVYFAIMLAMGVVLKSDIQEYWNVHDNIFQTHGFSGHMSKNRFLLLNRYLHFNDNEALDAYLSRPQAKLYKLKPIIEHLNRKFSELYQLRQNICIDESLTQWKGCLDIKQYIPNKAAFAGVKTYEICESQTGYLYRFEIYAGHEEEEQTEASPVSGFVPSLVLRLLKGLESQGHTLWMDNYYNSPALARTLKSLGFDCAGTLRTNLSFVPQDVNNLKTGKIPMQKGQMIGCTSGDIDIVVWSDIKVVAFVSTYHGMGVSWCPAEKKNKPILVRDYNVCMGGVDKKDQMLAMYPIERKRMAVWYKKFFKRILNASVLNAYLLHKHSNVPEQNSAHVLSHRLFRQRLVLELLNRHQTQRRPVSTLELRNQCVLPLFPKEIVQHFTISYPEVAPGSKEKLRRSCVVCHKRVRTHCPTCNVALCLAPCAQTYHQHGPKPRT